MLQAMYAYGSPFWDSLVGCGSSRMQCTQSCEAGLTRNHLHAYNEDLESNGKVPPEPKDNVASNVATESRVGNEPS